MKGGRESAFLTLKKIYIVNSDLNEAIAVRDKLAAAFGHNQQANFVDISNEIKL